ncbi:MAG: hypothetical protein P9L92_07995 [Candidatus Electryonea clarkiae]|nr:hypothetical protein [Candidatus Electryonea clarkiae]
MSTKEQKRLRLQILRSGESKIQFNLSENWESTKITKAERKITKREIDSLVNYYHRGIKQREKDYWNQVHKILAKSLKSKSPEDEIFGDEVRNILSSQEWVDELNIAKTRYRVELGRFILKCSKKIYYNIMPLENDIFWDKFQEIVDFPTLNALKSQEDRKYEIPLLQIRIGEDLLNIPWWLSRTADQKSIWCCRYAFAISSLGDTYPPKLKFDDLKILTITRPTFDLNSFPLKEEMIEILLSLFNQDSCKWNFLDGEIENIDQLNSIKENGDFDTRRSFQGITDIQVRDLISSRSTISPNLIFYNGHWDCELVDNLHVANIYFDNEQGLTVHDFLKKDSRWVTGFLTGAPLLNTIPPDNCKDSLIIMNACRSAVMQDHGATILEYISKGSLFVGSNFSLLSDVEGSSANDFLMTVLKNQGNQFVSHSLLQAQVLTDDLVNGDDKNEKKMCELYQKTSLCIFGDVRAHLSLPYDSRTKDNILPVKLIITDRWQPSFDELEINPKGGLTYRIIKYETVTPITSFALRDEEIEIGLAPLATAIRLCVEDSNYVILGPAFASSGSIGLASKNIKNFQEFKSMLIKSFEDKKVMNIAILQKKLTSTFMIRTFIKHILLENGGIKNDQIDKEYIKIINEIEILSIEKLNNILVTRNINKYDCVLLLGNDLIDLSKNHAYNIISNNIEDVTASLLELPGKIIPRGIFICKRGSLANHEWKPFFEEFFAEYNSGVSKIKNEGSKTIRYESEKDLPLLSYSKSDPNHLLAIKLIAESNFFNLPSVFDWDNFAFRNHISIQKLKDYIGNYQTKIEGTEKQKSIFSENLEVMKQFFLDQLNKRESMDSSDLKKLTLELCKRTKITGVVVKEITQDFTDEARKFIEVMEIT